MQENQPSTSSTPDLVTPEGEEDHDDEETDESLESKCLVNKKYPNAYTILCSAA
jgi:hypothetical protein